MSRFPTIPLLLGGGLLLLLGGLAVVRRGVWNDDDPVGMRSSVSGGDATTTGLLIAGVGVFLMLIAFAVHREGKK